MPRSLTDDGGDALYVTDSIVGFRSVGERPPVPLIRFVAAEGTRSFATATTTCGPARSVRDSGAFVRAAQRGFRDRARTELTGLSSDGVLALMEDRDGNLWAGTSEGLNRLVPRRIIRVTISGSSQASSRRRRRRVGRHD